MKLFTIPNLFTLGNLLCGCLAIVFAFDNDLVWSAYLVGIACVFDFLDGFLARLLKQHSEIGKQLDSLADMVTFGVVPGIVMFMMLRFAFMMHDNSQTGFFDSRHGFAYYPFAFIAFLIPIFSALRLAKFNVDTRQSDSFIGVPTPANSILICSLPLIMKYYEEANIPEIRVKMIGFIDIGEPVLAILQNPWFLVSVTIMMSILLIVELPLFALKFKSFGWKGNETRYVFLALCVVLLATLKFIGIPLIIVLYVLMSVVNNAMTRKVTGDR